MQQTRSNENKIPTCLFLYCARTHVSSSVAMLSHRSIWFVRSPSTWLFFSSSTDIVAFIFIAIAISIAFLCRFFFQTHCTNEYNNWLCIPSNGKTLKTDIRNKINLCPFFLICFFFWCYCCCCCCFWTFKLRWFVLIFWHESQNIDTHQIDFEFVGRITKEKEKLSWQWKISFNINRCLFIWLKYFCNSLAVIHTALGNT